MSTDRITSRLLSFEKLHNIRDLGGMETASGRVIRSGRLIRSGHLSSLAEADAQKLAPLIDTIVDFRTDLEHDRQPDAEFEGVENYHISIVDSLTAGISREEKSDQMLFMKYLAKPEEAKVYMSRMYRGLVSEFTMSRYEKFIRILLEPHERAVLWHCTAGKDRAGIASVLVEEILGVPEETIIADYLMTNEYLKEDIVFLTGMLRKQTGIEGPELEESLKYLFGAERDFLQSFCQAVDETFGGMEGLIRDGLHVSQEEIRELQERYLI